jgi:hypothetical protein
VTIVVAPLSLASLKKAVSLLMRAQWNGKQIIPIEWLKEMTKIHAEHLSKVAIAKEQRIGYGDHIWLMAPHQIALRGHRGHRGQVIFNAYGYAQDGRPSLFCYKSSSLYLDACCCATGVDFHDPKHCNGQR